MGKSKVFQMFQWSETSRDKSYVASCFPLLRKLSTCPPADDQFWQALFRNDALRVLRLNNAEVVNHCRAVIGGSDGRTTASLPPFNPALAALLTHTATLVTKVVNQRRKLVTNRGGTFGPGGGNFAPSDDAAVASSALHLCQLCCHTAACTLSVQDFAAAMGRGGSGATTTTTANSSAASSSASPSSPSSKGGCPLESLVDATLELVAESSHVSTAYYEVVLEGVNFLLVLLSTQLYSPAACRGAASAPASHAGGSGGGTLLDFVTSAEEDAALGAAMSAARLQLLPKSSPSPAFLTEQTSADEAKAAAASGLGYWFGYRSQPQVMLEDTNVAESAAGKDSPLPSPPQSSSTSPSPLPPSSSLESLSRTPSIQRAHFGLQVMMQPQLERRDNQSLSRQRRRAAQACRVVEAVLAWVVSRPQVPPLGTAPATACAVDAEEALAAARGAARGKRGAGGGARAGVGGTLATAHGVSASTLALVNGAPSSFFGWQVRWGEAVQAALVALLTLPLRPVLPVLSLLSSAFAHVRPANSSLSPSSSSASQNELVVSSSGADLEGGGGGGAAEDSAWSSPSWLQTTQNTAHPSSSPLAERGSLLLLLLCHNYRVNPRQPQSRGHHEEYDGNDDCGGNTRRCNPFRDALASLSDPRLEGLLPQTDRHRAGRGGGGGSGFGSGEGIGGVDREEEVLVAAATCSFEQVLLALSRAIQHEARGEPAVLLLYTLLHGNPHFLTSLLARSDLDTVLVPLLERLYHAPDVGDSGRDPTSPTATLSTSPTSSNAELSVSSLYVGVIVLLTFTQDEGFGATAFQHLVLPAVPWYKERYLKDVSLGSLVVLCSLRCLVHTLSALADFYLVETVLASLGNLAPHSESLHPYAAQRLVAVLNMSLRKLATYSNRLAHAKAREEKQERKEQEEQERRLKAEPSPSGGSALMEECPPPLSPPSSPRQAGAAVGGAAAAVREEEAPPSSGPHCASGGGGGSTAKTTAKGAEESSLDLEPMVQVYGKCANTLLAFLSAGLRPGKPLRRNTQLLYMVMHRQRELLDAASLFGVASPVAPAAAAASSAPSAADSSSLPPAASAAAAIPPGNAFIPRGDAAAAVHGLLTPFPPLIQFMNERLDTAANAKSQANTTSSSFDKGSGGGDGGSGSRGDLSVDEVTAVLESSAAAYLAASPTSLAAPNDPRHGAVAMAQFLPPKVAYEEQEEPEAFFVPYAWDVARTHTARDLLWFAPVQAPP